MIPDIMHGDRHVWQRGRRVSRSDEVCRLRRFLKTRPNLSEEERLVGINLMRPRENGEPGGRRRCEQWNQHRLTSEGVSQNYVIGGAKPRQPSETQPAQKTA